MIDDEPPLPIDHYALLIAERASAAEEIVERAAAATLRRLGELMREDEARVAAAAAAEGDAASSSVGNDARVQQALAELERMRTRAIEATFEKIRESHGITEAAEAAAEAAHSGDPFVARLHARLHETLQRGLLGESPEQGSEWKAAAAEAIAGRAEPGAVDADGIPSGMTADKFYAALCRFTTANAVEFRWLVGQTQRFALLGRREKAQLVAPLGEDAFRRSIDAAGLSAPAFRACNRIYAPADPRVAAELARAKAELDDILRPLDVPRTAEEAAARQQAEAAAAAAAGAGSVRA